MTSAHRAWWLAFVGLLTSASLLTAQTGSLAGKVTDAQAKVPLSGVRVAVLNPALRQVGGGSSGADGSYRVADIAPGSYTVVFSMIGYTSKRTPNVQISAGGTAQADAELASKAYEINEVVVSASRVPEKILDAPASVSTVSQIEIQERPSMTVTDHLKGIPGVDISQGGILQANVVARGFNNAFSGTLLTLIDNRYASVPSLRVNIPAFFPATNEDIERIEFVLGPAAALYGPNASNGVLHIITKSPFTSAGTTLSFEGGVRGTTPGAIAGTDNAAGIGRFSFRNATVLSDKVAFKISGEYLKGRDWRYADVADTVSPGPTPTTRTYCGAGHPYGCRDFDLKKWGGEARVDVRPDKNTEWITTYGRSTAGSLIDLTGIGAGQVKDWTYQSFQTRFRHKALFLQGFLNKSDAGDTFILRSGNPIIDQSRLWTFQAQHGFDFGTKETIL
ncbi:MAG: TonB-dependent receptor plug domain-containing protein, partial [Gemmatimonadota bacterium]